MILPNGETVTRLRATAATNVYSGESEGIDWDTPAELDIDGVAVAPGATIEPLEVGRTPVQADFTLYLPYGVDVAPEDRVVVRGEECSVEGERADWRNPYTAVEAGSVVLVRKVTG